MSGWKLREYIENNNIDGLQDLLETGIDLNAKHRADIYNAEEAPLEWAARKSSCKTMRWLLEHGASLHAYDDDCSITHFFCSRLICIVCARDDDNEKLVRTLVEAGAELGDVGSITDIVGVAPVLRFGSSPVYHAVENGNLNIARYLLEAGVSPNACGIPYYCDRITAGARPTPLYVRPLTILESRYPTDTDCQVAKLLFEYASDGLRSQSVACTAAYFGVLHQLEALATTMDSEHFAALINTPLDVDPPLERHSGVMGTPLHAAATCGHVDVARFLLQHGADVNAPSCTAAGAASDTPLRRAVLYSSQRSKTAAYAMVRLLCEQGANVDSPDGDFVLSPLYGAMERRDTEMLRILVHEFGANVNAVGRARLNVFNPTEETVVTPLTQALRTGCLSRAQLEMVEFMLNAGANVSSSMLVEIMPMLQQRPRDLKQMWTRVLRQMLALTTVESTDSLLEVIDRNLEAFGDNPSLFCEFLRAFRPFLESRMSEVLSIVSADIGGPTWVDLSILQTVLPFVPLRTATVSINALLVRAMDASRWDIVTECLLHGANPRDVPSHRRGTLELECSLVRAHRCVRRVLIACHAFGLVDDYVVARIAAFLWFFEHEIFEDAPGLSYDELVERHAYVERENRWFLSPIDMVWVARWCREHPEETRATSVFLYGVRHSFNVVV